jgi:hypothetical protein
VANVKKHEKNTPLVFSKNYFNLGAPSMTGWQYVALAFLAIGAAQTRADICKGEVCEYYFGKCGAFAA